MKKNKINLVSILLYTASIIMFSYALLTIYNSHIYISSLVAAQRLVIKNEILSVVIYYCNAALPYVFYSIATFAMGYIINKLSSKNDLEYYKKIHLQNYNKVKESEEDLDDFMEEFKTN